MFAGETVIVIVILLLRGPAAPRRRSGRRRRSTSSASPSRRSGSVVVFGILKTSEWGLIEPRGALTIGGEEVTPFGFSGVPFLILAGRRPARRLRALGGPPGAPGRDTLLDRKLLRIVHLRAGLPTLMMQQLILLGTFFVLPVYLQVVLGLDAFETGKRLFPLSVAHVRGRARGPRLAAGSRPSALPGRARGAGGRVASAAGTIDVELDDAGFAISLALFGIGAGLLLSQLGNVIMSSVAPDQTNEAGGLQGTAQNLGASLGTALIGAVLIAALTSGFVDRVEENPAVPPGVRDRVAEVAQRGIQVVPVDDVEQAALDQGVPAEQAQAIADDYGDAQLQGLKRAIGAVAMFALLWLWFTRHLPGRVPKGPDL